MTPEDRVAAVASRYDGPDDEAGQLEESALRRLAYRSRQGGKVCTLGQHAAPLSAFGPDARQRDGLRSACRACEERRARRLPLPV